VADVVDPPISQVEEAVRVAFTEAHLLAHQDIPVDRAARDLLKYVSRRRSVLEVAIIRVGEDVETAPDPLIRQRAVEVLERALELGLFY